jgi:hypothetical protein
MKDNLDTGPFLPQADTPTVDKARSSDSHSPHEDHGNGAALDEISPAIEATQDHTWIAGEVIDEGQKEDGNHANLALVDHRFSDPLVAEILETWRMRRDMVRAQSRLTLQAKAICRRFCEGEIKEADKLYTAVTKGKDHPLAASAGFAIMPLVDAMQPLVKNRAAFERHLTKLGAQLPIAHMSDQIKGIGHLALAKVVAECGDLSAYKSVAAVWKRAGLAVIDGERQRKCSNAEKAIAHGYSPSRRSTFWNMADALLKCQGKDEDAGPYRQIYDARKAFEKAKGTEEKPMSDLHAHNRALRYMTKCLLKDLTVEWRAINRP